MIKLSVLIPSVSERRESFLPKSLNSLYGQLESLPKDIQEEIEILYLVDNKTIMLGDKRNMLIDICKGEYISFVDDDDRITDDYLISLYEATKSDCDSIVFQASVSINSESPKICYYSKEYPRDFNSNDAYFRLPNHICCIKKSVSKKVSFPSLKYAEDSHYSKLLKKHLRTEYKIDKVLYHYDYNSLTTVAQEDLPSVKSSRVFAKPPIVDVVFISDAKNRSFQLMTQKAIDTCHSGANGLHANCIVVESQKGIKYRDATVINPDIPFNYNAYLNLGAKQGNAEYIMFCNNDLIFQNGWLHALLSAEYSIVSPKCPRDKRQKDIKENTAGYECGKHLSGWAFMMTRDLWLEIGGLDGEFDFWFADNSFIGQLKNLNIEPMIVPDSLVIHLGSSTLRTSKDRENLMWSKLERYNEKYNDNLFTDNANYLRWKQRN